MTQSKEKATTTSIVLPEFLTDEERNAVEKCIAARQELEAYFKEREDVIELLFLLRLSKMHGVLFGPPGTGKSYLIQSFNAHFTGSVYFEWQVQKFTVPEEIFGQYSIKELENDRFVRVMDGKLPRANVAYLDELFNANSSILNALNGPMNERWFQGEAIPLETLLAATNFMPEDKVLVAFFDRFLVRVILGQINESANFEAMLKLGPYKPVCTINKDEIEMLQQKVSKIDVKAIYPGVSKIRELLRVDHLEPSDRRFKWALKLMQARALLYGREACTQDDLWILRYVLWTDPKEIAMVEGIVAKSIDPDAARIQELYAQATDIAKQIAPLDDKDPDFFKKVTEGAKKLDIVADEIAAMRQGRVMMVKAQQVAENIEKAVRDKRAKILKEKLGL